MTRILILGASGQIARHVIDMLASDAGLQQTLYLRQAHKLQNEVPANASVVEVDVLDHEALQSAMRGQQIIYANLTGDDLDVQARAVVDAMQATGVPRLVFVTSLGIYDEVPGRFGEWNRREIGEYLPPFRRAADAIEASGLDYTVLRPAWLQDEDEIDFETTQKGEPFKGTEVSRKSVAALIVEIIRSPALHSNENIGVNKPGSDGDKPSFH